MILGIEFSKASCGWALLDDRTCEFADLGVVALPRREDGRTATLERERRAHTQARLLAEKVPVCSLIVVEQLPPEAEQAASAALAIGVAWGLVLGVAAMTTPRPKLLTIPRQRWQREVLPSAGDQVETELARAAGAHLLRRHPKAARALARLQGDDRNRAIDAAMIALVGALRPHRCAPIGPPPEARIA